MKAVFAAVVMLYLALDFGNPALPGAFSFDIGESVEGVQLERDPSPAPPVLAVTPEPRLARVRVAPQMVRRRAVGGAPSPLHSSRHFASDPPDPSGPEEG